jgi:hypothetical protein
MDQDQNKPANGFGILSKLGLNFDTEIEGCLVTEAKQTTRPNTFQLTIAKDANDKHPRKAFVGKKSIEQGLLGEDDKGQAVIAKGFETYTNPQQEVWIRNKERALATLKAID